MNYKDFKKELMKNAEFRKEWNSPRSRIGRFFWSLKVRIEVKANKLKLK